jgi:histidyl-tRNA synthetase
LLIALEASGFAAAGEGIDVFFVCEEGADRLAVAAALKTLRGRGKRADMDYAGRSVKGQHTQAGRLRAQQVVVVTSETDLGAVLEELG